MSSSDEIVVQRPRPVRKRSGTRTSVTGNVAALQQPVPPSVSPASALASGPVAGRARSAAAAAKSSQQSSSSAAVSPAASTVGSAAAAAAAAAEGPTPATRTGRVIKKPVRLEEQNPGRQTLPGRSGRADAPAKLAAARAAAAAAAAAAEEASAAGPSNVVGNSKPGGQAAGKNHVAVEAPSPAPAPAAGGAERCVARLGKAAAADDGAGTGNRNTASMNGSSSNGSGGTGTKEASSSASAALPSSTGGSMVRMALPVEGRTSGLTPNPNPKPKAEEAVASGSGDASKKARGAVRERDRLVVLDPLPERPVGGLGSAPDETIKEYSRAFHDVRERVRESVFYCPGLSVCLCR